MTTPSLTHENRVTDDLPTIEAALHQAAAAGGEALLRRALTLLAGRIAVVSSFGADSAVLLALAAETDPAVPVIFLQTGMHFDETLAYRHDLAATLGLQDVRDIEPLPADLAASDPGATLWQYDPDSCCALRKVAPLDRALAPFTAWVSGRKRYQSATRRTLPLIEREGARIKLNPLADWDATRIAAETRRRGLPHHPLVTQHYPSIGCGPCTVPVAHGVDARAGRWAGSAKTECGIHRPPQRT